MSNEPNEAEKKLVAEMDATEIWLSPQETRRKRMAEILAAHRRDESELAKALEDLAARWYDPMMIRDGYLIYRQCASELRAALAARKAE